MFRKIAMKKSATHTGHFVWRNHEILRIESFSDAVLAFAVTLTVVSLEVPVTFHELLNSMRGMIGFGICFLFLIMIWHQQYEYFRWFGLRDTATIVLNSILLFVIIFYVYPLKFLFNLLVMGNFVAHEGNTVERIANYNEVLLLMVIYSAGFIVIQGLFYLLYRHAYSCRDQLKLSLIEQFNLRTEMYKYFIMMSVGVVAIALAFALPVKLIGLSGVFFSVIGIALSMLYSKRIRIRKRIFTSEENDYHHELIVKSQRPVGMSHLE